VLAGSAADASTTAALHGALATKDASAVLALAGGLAGETRAALRAMLRLYGGDEVPAAARRELPRQPQVGAALDDLEWLAAHLRHTHPQVRVGFDLADLGGYDYYSGARFSIYARGASDALARGGRYDEVGAVFGRNRPAVGFSMDLKEVVALARRREMPPAVRAPWGEDAALRLAVRQLRERGETVVCVLPGHEHEGQEFECDRELVAVAGQWVVRAL
jgi:ATP phosphoribosyltransferase regulatory subunit